MKSRLSEESCLFKGQSVQQGLQLLQFFVDCKNYFVKKTVKKNIKLDKMTSMCILY
jgi:hypothetical protein